MRIAGEMRRHPVEQHAQAVRVAGVDEAAQPRRVAEARGRRVKAQRLVAPRAVEGMLGDRQQLDMREAKVRDVGRQRGRELVPAMEAAVGVAPPAARVHLVDRQRCAARIGLGAAGRQRACRRQRLGDGAGGLGAHLRRARVGVALQRKILPVAGADRILVAVALDRVRDEQLPDAGAAARAHRVAARVPAVEVADHGHARGVRRPDREAHAVDRVDALAQRRRVRAQHLERPQVAALAEVVQVQLADQRPDPVGVGEAGRAAVVPGHLQPVVEVAPPARDRPLEQPRRVPPRQPRHAGPGPRIVHRDLGRARQQRAHAKRAVGLGVHAQDRERVRVARLDEGVNVVVVQHGRSIVVASRGMATRRS